MKEIKAGDWIWGNSGKYFVFKAEPASSKYYPKNVTADVIQIRVAETFKNIPSADPIMWDKFEPIQEDFIWVIKQIFNIFIE